MKECLKALFRRRGLKTKICIYKLERKKKELCRFKGKGEKKNQEKSFRLRFSLKCL